MQLGLFRALFPRWNFFDQVSHDLSLEFKPVGLSEWQVISFDAVRTPFSLLINPAVTLLYAEMSLLADFTSDLRPLIGADGLVNSRDVFQLTTFQMIKSLVFSRLIEFETNAVEFQFRVIAKSEVENSVVFVSDVLAGE